MRIEELYDKYFKNVYLYMLRLSGSVDIAEEITSETFFAAMKKIDSFRGECSVTTWLCGIAKNLYSKYNRKHRRELSLDDEIAQYEISEGIEDSVIDHDQALRIKQHLHELPDTYKEVFMWRVFAELSFEEIGAMFGKSANWACVTYHRARKKIAERMEEET